MPHSFTSQIQNWNYKINIINKLITLLRWQKLIPGNFFARKEALVIALETVLTTVVGESATLIPIGPSDGWPDGLTFKEFLIAFVTWKE